MLRRALQHGSAIPVLLALLALHALYVLPQNDESLVIARSTIPAGRNWFIVIDSNGNVLQRGFEQPGDEAYRHVVVEISVTSGRWTSGWWAATRRNVGFQASYVAHPNERWDEDVMVREVGQLLDVWREALTPAELLSLRPSGGLRHTSVIWSGYLHNMVALALVLLLAYASQVQVRRTLSRMTTHRRMVRGHCPICNYDLRGGTSGSCPECGWTG